MDRPETFSVLLFAQVFRDTLLHRVSVSQSGSGEAAEGPCQTLQTHVGSGTSLTPLLSLDSVQVSRTAVANPDGGCGHPSIHVQQVP